MRVRGAIILIVALAVSGGAVFSGARVAPAAVATRELAPLPYAAQTLTAYDGYVVFSQSNASGGAWHLMVWHAGAISALPVPRRTVPFDADAGPGANGQPEVVFSACAVEPRMLQGQASSGPEDMGGTFGTVLDWSTASGCHIDELGLRGGASARVTQISAHGASDTTPTIWRGAIAFARLLQHPHTPPVPEIMLWRSGSPLRRLAGGPRPCRRAGPCVAEPANAPVGAFVASMDLGPHALAVDWYFEGSNVMEGIGPQWRLLADRLSGGRAADVADGFVGGACTSYNPLSPNESGSSVVVYAQDQNECEYKPGSSQFEKSAFEPGDIAPTGGGYIAALAKDGTTSYWLRVEPTNPTVQDDYAPVCEPGITACALIQSASSRR